MGTRGSFPGREADHSPPPNAEVNAWSYTSTHHYVFMAWCLVKHREKFTFTFHFAAMLCIIIFVYVNMFAEISLNGAV